MWKKPTGETRNGKITKLFTFKGIGREEAAEAQAGDIAMIAGLADIYIGENHHDGQEAEPLPAIHVDEPTIALNFLVNNSSFCRARRKVCHIASNTRAFGKKELETKRWPQGGFCAE